jgi:hypothetical protein
MSRGFAGYMPGNPGYRVGAPARLSVGRVNSWVPTKRFSLTGNQSETNRGYHAPDQTRGSIMATILDAIYRAFLREFFARNAQDRRAADGADLNPRHHLSKGSLA